MHHNKIELLKYRVAVLLIVSFDRRPEANNYSTVQKKCKRNSVFFVLCSRENSTKFRQSVHEFSWSQTKFRCHLGEISDPLKRNFVLQKFLRGENSQLQNFHKAKFCWQQRRVVMKTFCSDRFKPLARVIYLVQTSVARAALEVRVFM